jgi:hypothetical protein
MRAALYVTVLSSLGLPLLWAATPPAAAIAVVKAPGPVRLLLSDAVRERIRDSSLVNLPTAQRSVNWSVGHPDNGSCMWASAMNLLRWQGREPLAKWIGENRGGAASFRDLVDVLDHSNCPWAYGNTEAFLEWACRTHRGAIVSAYQGTHALNLVGLDDENAWVLDNTGPQGQQIVRYSRADFIRQWRESGPAALTPMGGSPTPPQPWILKTEDAP